MNNMKNIRTYKRRSASEKAFAVNGDEVSGTFDGYPSPTDTPRVYDNHENADVTGGTGRFTSDTGNFQLGGQINFAFGPALLCPSLGGNYLNCRLEEELDIESIRTWQSAISRVWKKRSTDNSARLST
jgi:hypothetical protein